MAQIVFAEEDTVQREAGGRRTSRKNASRYSRLKIIIIAMYQRVSVHIPIRVFDYPDTGLYCTTALSHVDCLSRAHPCSSASDSPVSAALPRKFFRSY